MSNDDRPRLTEFAAAVNLTQATVGIGLLSLPYATSQIGFIPSVVGTVAIAGASAAGIFVGVECIYAREETETCKLVGDKPVATPRCIREDDTLGLGFLAVLCRDLFGPGAQYLCGTCTLLGQLIGAAASIGVVADTVARLFGRDDRDVALLGIWLLFSAVATVRNLQEIAGISLLALGVSGLIVFAVVRSSVEDLPLRDSGSVHWFDFSHGISGFGVWFGLTTFAFGCFGVAQYVCEDMRIGHDPTPFYRALAKSFGLTTLLYIFMGTFGYYCYGSATKEIIFFSHTGASPFFIAGCQLGTCVVLTLSYALTMHPVFTWAELHLPGPAIFWYPAITAVLVLVSWTVPSFAVLIGIFGVAPAFLLCFILPAACHLRLFGRHISRSLWLLDIGLISFGIFGMLLATACALMGGWEQDDLQFLTARGASGLHDQLARIGRQLRSSGDKETVDISIVPAYGSVDPMEIPYSIAFGVVLCCAVLVAIWSRVSLRSGNNQVEEGDGKLKYAFLSVWYICVAGDWLQGPYVYALYQAYGFATVDIAKLFVAGFAASMLFGPCVGALADKIGRRRVCQLYCVLHAMSCVTKHFQSYWILFIGRLLGGTATSLLFSAFDAWLVSEHARMGCSQEALQHTFAMMWVGSSVVAILAGLLGDAVVALQPLTPVATIPGMYVGGFVLAFDVAGVLLVVGCLLMGLLWRENFGSDGTAPFQVLFQDAMRTIWSSQTLITLMILVACFEATMYAFIFSWTPALTNAFTTPAHGKVFATLMTACLAGSICFDIVSAKGVARPEVLLQRILALGSVALTVTGLVLRWWSPSALQVLTVLGTLVVFEFVIGFYFPLISTIKGLCVPERLRTTIYNIYRIPLNGIVLVVLLSDCSLPLIFVATGALLMLASSAALYLSKDTRTPLLSCRSPEAI